MTRQTPFHPQAIGVYGGAFDPVHVGHMRVAIEALEQLDLSKVIWTPTGVAGHRDQTVADASDRLAMLEAALADHRFFEIDPTDLQSPEVTYTVRTLKRLRTVYGEAQPLVFIVGLDAFLGLTSWFEWPKLLEMAHIAVAARPDYDRHSAKPELKKVWEQRHAALGDIHAHPAGCIVEFPMMALDISSSTIREKYRQGHDVRYLLPEGVRAYLAKHPIYV